MAACSLDERARMTVSRELRVLEASVAAPLPR